MITQTVLASVEADQYRLDHQLYDENFLALNSRNCSTALTILLAPNWGVNRAGSSEDCFF